MKLIKIIIALGTTTNFAPAFAACPEWNCMLLTCKKGASKTLGTIAIDLPEGKGSGIETICNIFGDDYNTAEYNRFSGRLNKSSGTEVNKNQLPDFLKSYQYTYRKNGKCNGQSEEKALATCGSD